MGVPGASLGCDVEYDPCAGDPCIVLLPERAITRYRILLRLLVCMYCMSQRRCAAKVAQLHGGLSATRRAAEITRFSTDRACRVFLVSIKAGALGLNLIAATRVIICEPGCPLGWSNPTPLNETKRRNG